MNENQKDLEMETPEAAEPAAEAEAPAEETAAEAEADEEPVAARSFDEIMAENDKDEQ